MATIEELPRQGQAPGPRRPATLNYLLMMLAVNGLAILGLTWVVFSPVMKTAATASAQERPAFSVPDYVEAYAAWHKQPVQVDGRTKPFETFAIESVRSIYGKAKLDGKDPVAVVLNWMMLQGGGQGANFIDWETFPFILCEHHGLRAWVYAHKIDGGQAFLDKLKDVEIIDHPMDEVQSKITALGAALSAHVAALPSADAEAKKLLDEQLHGKYIAPADLRNSPGLLLLIEKIDLLRDQDSDKFMQYLAPEQNKAREVAGRLHQFDGIAQNSPPALKKRMGKGPLHEDPLHVVVLDRVPGSAWLSLGQLRSVIENPAVWNAAPGGGMMMRGEAILAERLKATPQDYVNPEQRETLRQFQTAIREKRGAAAVSELEGKLKERREAGVAAFRQRWATEKVDIRDLVRDDLIRPFNADPARADRLIKWLQKAQDAEQRVVTADVLTKIREVLEDRDREAVETLRSRVTAAEVGKPRFYRPDDMHFRMLHLDYLEMLYPDLYHEALAWQKFPKADAEKVLAAYGELQAAYKSEDAAQFTAATTKYFEVIREVSERTTLEGFTAAYQPEGLRSAAKAALENPSADRAELRSQLKAAGFAPGSYLYPGTTTLDLEMRFNRLQPFMWGWVLMLPAVLVFAFSQASGSRWLYTLGFALYLASLGFQLYGFYARIAIAGRPPVSNMYETVIFVATMSAVFALVLEAVYRNTIFALAGAAVSTVALVLADQLPLVLDPKISPLVPVLRSNLWLIVHVMTIVASYAGGTLAWGLGNLSLALLAFGRPRPDTVKMLAQYTRRGLEIAILLLGIGTFLGGIWAAFSWGRFWGWDPKETWALIALVVYVIPLHARYVGWVKDFGLAVGAVLCYAAIVMCWYGVNFVLGAGLHSYGFGGGGPYWVLWAGLINVQWVILASWLYLSRKHAASLASASAA
jgi:ABC-type transport system involved in cytochrome c biogenesis permease subunit